MVWLFKAGGREEGGLCSGVYNCSCRRHRTDQEGALPAWPLHRVGCHRAGCADDVLFHGDVALTLFHEEALEAPPRSEITCKKFDLLGSWAFHSCWSLAVAATLPTAWPSIYFRVFWLTLTQTFLWAGLRWTVSHLPSIWAVLSQGSLWSEFGGFIEHGWVRGFLLWRWKWIIYYKGCIYSSGLHIRWYSLENTDCEQRNWLWSQRNQNQVLALCLSGFITQISKFIWFGSRDEQDPSP